MARTNDFAFVFFGSNAFELKEVAAASFEIDTKAYENAKQAKKGARTLTLVASGADGDLAPGLKQTMDFIRQKTGNRLDTIGSFVAVGTSNSCSMVLALAAELKQAGAPKLNYVGVTDVTIMPFGRQPSVPNVGTLQPINEPTWSALVQGDPSLGAASLGLILGSLTHLSYPSLATDPPPQVTITGSIEADKKRNFYQKLGNHVKLVKSSPLDGGLDWWWWSDMKNGEVHGEVAGFSNRPFTGLSGSSDDDFHISACNRSAGMPWGIMLAEAGAALADLPA